MEWAAGLPLKAGDLFLGLYQPSPETAGFWEGVDQDELRLKHCNTCGKDHHPRRIMCSDCQSLDLAWVSSSGKGEVYSFSQVHHSTGEFKQSLPYVVGIVALDAGVHMFSRILADDQSTIAIGSAVKLEFMVMERGQKMPVFRVGEAA